LTLTVASGCSSDDDGDQTDARTKPVCDGKLSGSVFDTVVGSGGVKSEYTKEFHPAKWTAYGYCSLYSKEHFVEISYLWHTDTTTDLKRIQSPSPSTAKTFKVGSAIGYIEVNRARVIIPCSIPGEPASEHALIEVEVKDNPPALRTLDSELGKAFASAATIAARYLGGEVFDCPAFGSGSATESTSPSPSNT
jgi:hypothetical protein